MNLSLKWILEDLYSRRDMPQIKGSDVSKAIEMLRDEGIQVTESSVLPSKLKHSQKWVNPDKIKGIIAKIHKGDKISPVIVSKDYHIVDGHHRHMAQLKDNPKKPIKVIIIHLNRDEAIEAYKQVSNSMEIA